MTKWQEVVAIRVFGAAVLPNDGLSGLELKAEKALEASETLARKMCERWGHSKKEGACLRCNVAPPAPGLEIVSPPVLEQSELIVRALNPQDPRAAGPHSESIARVLARSDLVG